MKLSFRFTIAPCVCLILFALAGCTRDNLGPTVEVAPEVVASGFPQGSARSDSVVINYATGYTTGPYDLSSYSTVRVSFDVKTLFAPGYVGGFSWGVAGHPLIVDTLSTGKTRSYARYMYFFQIDHPDSTRFIFKSDLNTLIQFKNFTILGWRIERSVNP